ncbi:DUF2490 domain-containing protein [Aurantibacter sp.]|uniref:DUF2490 domain-containing protein n=1 Tax=Aurantibacter sp. TaxID=2807103 RepID=UPI00326629A5
MIKFIVPNGSFCELKKVVRVSLVILCLMLTSFNYGQKDRESIVGSWVVISGNNKISNRLSIPTVGILRHYKMFENYEFSFFRTGLTYKVNNNFYVSGGAAYLDSDPYVESATAMPNRQIWIYEEVTYLSKIKKVSISNRVRLESRWISNSENIYVNDRIRYRLQGKFPLTENFYLKSYNEIFINLKSPYFNQNRFFCGLGYRFSKNLLLDIGYLNNHFDSGNYDRLRMAVYFKTDFTKKKLSRK